MKGPRIGFPAVKGPEDRFSIARLGGGPARAVILAVWSLVVWGGRLRNLIVEPGGPGDLTGGQRWSLVGSLLFGLLAVATLATAAAARRFTVVPAAALAVLSIVVWAYRAVVILGREYSAGFMAVHTVLAGVSIGLGLWYLRSISGGGRGAT